jgi:hypothetical protein
MPTGKSKAPKLNDHDRLARYVERFFLAHKKTKWPTVRRIAKSFGWKHDRIRDAVDGDPDSRMFTSSYNMSPEPPFGKHFVETC